MFTPKSLQLKKKKKFDKLPTNCGKIFSKCSISTWSQFSDSACFCDLTAASEGDNDNTEAQMRKKVFVSVYVQYLWLFLLPRTNTLSISAISSVASPLTVTQKSLVKLYQIKPIQHEDFCNIAATNNGGIIDVHWTLHEKLHKT